MIKRLTRICLFVVRVNLDLSLQPCSVIRKAVIALCGALFLSNMSVAAEIELPLLGDSSSAIISKSQEYKLGKTWLQAFRSRVKQYDDPLLQAYLERLVFDLATYSDLHDARLTLIMINNPTINAFAVPGGIVGFHTGVFSYAENEDQLASILAHELAHLSQRHFARRLEARRNASVVSLAGLLATLVVSSTVGGDAGLAALSATQALTIEQQLRYSRSNEQEADRLGLKTMIKAGRDPQAVADMFENMLTLTRYNSSRVPEFLRTHPVTERRVADTRARTYTNSQRHYPESAEFYIMQARAQVVLQNNGTNSIKYFTRQLASNTQQSEAARYGLALAHLKQNDYRQAKAIIGQLLADSSNYLPFLYTDIEVDIAAQQYKSALATIDRQLKFNPNHYPLRVLQAEALWGAHSYDQAAEVLTQLCRHRPEDPMIWYKLAEVRGLAGDISGVHEARAEYFILIGALGEAKRQLEFAAKLVAADFKRLSVVKQRLLDLAVMLHQLEKL